MAKCIIIVFDTPRYGTCLDDIGNISPDEIKEVCDYEDRWDVFCKYLDDDYKDTPLRKDEEGLVYDDLNENNNFGLMLKR